MVGELVIYNGKGYYVQTDNMLKPVIANKVGSLKYVDSPMIKLDGECRLALPRELAVLGEDCHNIVKVEPKEEVGEENDTVGETKVNIRNNRRQPRQRP